MECSPPMSLQYSFMLNKVIRLLARVVGVWIRQLEVVFGFNTRSSGRTNRRQPFLLPFFFLIYQGEELAIRACTFYDGHNFFWRRRVGYTKRALNKLNSIEGQVSGLAFSNMQIVILYIMTTILLCWIVATAVVMLLAFYVDLTKQTMIRVLSSWCYILKWTKFIRYELLCTATGASSKQELYNLPDLAMVRLNQKGCQGLDSFASTDSLFSCVGCYLHIFSEAEAANSTHVVLLCRSSYLNFANGTCIWWSKFRFNQDCFMLLVCARVSLFRLST